MPLEITMTPLDYLLILEGMILLGAGAFWAAGEIFGRGNPKDELRRVMNAFWREFVRPTQMQVLPGLLGEAAAADELSTDSPASNKKSGKRKGGTADPARATATLSVKVVAGAGPDRIVGRTAEGVQIEVTCAPEGGQANKIVNDLLSAALGVPGYHIKLVRGHYDLRKTLQVSGMTSSQVDEKLANLI